ncbi:multicopper oxidase-domain-containing protein [Cunninghamella echinulata]|nr:multicopper oxidase-domain-containing protein [Cunninghamella echinulata]
MYFQYYIKVILASFLLPILVQGALRKFELRITQEDIDPDCSGNKIPAVLINQQFLAPTLRVNQDDEVEIHVYNDAVQPSGIHIHGIRQYGTSKSDGVPGITQKTIQPGDSFIQKFIVKEQHGTFLYHAHVGNQDDTIQGSFIVYPKEQLLPISNDPNGFEETTEYLPPSAFQRQDNYHQKRYPQQKNQELLKDGPYEYDDELILHISEFWHKSYKDREEYYMGPKYVFDPSSDSILINGRTIHDPKNKTNIYSTDGDKKCKGFTAFNVLPNKTYRLRVIGGNTFRVLGLQIKDHEFTIIEVDGELTQPYTTDNLEVAPGQRFSVLLHTKESISNNDEFVIATSYRYRSQLGTSWTENGFAYLRYIDAESTDEEVSPYDQIIPTGLIESLDHKNDNQESSSEAEKQNHTGPHGKRSKKYRSHEHYEEDEEDESKDRIEDEYSHNEEEKEHNKDGEYEHGDEHHGEATDNQDKNQGGWKGGKGQGDQNGEQNGKGGQGGHGGGQGGQGGGRGGRQGGGNVGGANARPPPVYDFISYPREVKLPPKDWIWPDLAPLNEDIYKEILDLEEPDRLFIFRSDIKNLPDNTTRFTINDRITTVMEHSNDDFILSKVLEKYPNPVNKRSQLESDGFDPEFQTYPVAMNETIDIVFQNVEHKGRCLIHPWHTHGHSHYLISSGVGEYNHEVDKDIRTFPHPIYKDVTTVYNTEVNPDTKGCGWTKVRLYTDNPGIWAVHCHVTAHMMLGKIAVIEEASELINTYSIYK